MSKLVRLFYTNTGLKGTPINPKKPKLSVAFTAERNDAGEQVVEYGVASCVPTDEFHRTIGRTYAEQALAFQLHDPSQLNAPYFGGVTTFPTGTRLDEIPALIVAKFEADKNAHNAAAQTAAKAVINEAKALEKETEALWAEHIEPRVKKLHELFAKARDLSPTAF